MDAHQKGIGGFSLHLRKQIIATASDDCTWKIWNMENGENIMTGEGHKDWICGIDFHPAGSHLVTSGADKAVKVWDFVNSTIAHTFANVHTGPVWKTKFHDTGDFVLSAGGDGRLRPARVREGRPGADDPQPQAGRLESLHRRDERRHPPGHDRQPALPRALGRADFVSLRGR